MSKITPIVIKDLWYILFPLNIAF